MSFCFPPFSIFSLSLFFKKYVDFSIHTIEATVGIVRILKKNLCTFVAKILATTRANKEIVTFHYRTLEVGKRPQNRPNQENQGMLKVGLAERITTVCYY